MAVRLTRALAEFVADRMTAAWLRDRGEMQEIEYRQHYWVDRRKYLLWLGDLKKALQEVYEQKENVLEKKAAVFKRFLAATSLIFKSLISSANVSGITHG